MQGGTQSFKVCPNCGLQAVLDAVECLQCGHKYSTQFNDPGKTQAVQPPPMQQQPQQQQQQQPQHVHYHYHGSATGSPTQSDIIQLPPGQHNQTIALLLSLFCVAGFAQMYNRQVVKGVCALIGMIVFGLLTFGIAALVMWPVLVFDAIRIADKLALGNPVGQWEFF